MNQVMTAQDWSVLGFEEVNEVVPGRIYEVWGPEFQHFRIFVTQAIVGGSRVKWNTSIDESVSIQGKDQTISVWARDKDVAQRLLGDDANEALMDGARWLSDYMKRRADS